MRNTSSDWSQREKEFKHTKGMYDRAGVQHIVTAEMSPLRHKECSICKNKLVIQGHSINQK